MLGLVARTAREHDARRRPRSLVGLDAIAIVGRAHPGDRRVGPHGCSDRGRVVADRPDDLGHGHVAVRVAGDLRGAGEGSVPRRREQPQRVPALGSPRVGHLTALEHDMVDAPLGEAAAHGKAGVPGPDDHGRRAHGRADGRWWLGRVRPQPTVTLTGVGLVRASNTAERFCDCATRPAISSGVASASMSKWTLTSLKPLRTSGSPPRMPRMLC